VVIVKPRMCRIIYHKYLWIFLLDFVNRTKYCMIYRCLLYFFKTSLLCLLNVYIFFIWSLTLLRWSELIILWLTKPLTTIQNTTKLLTTIQIQSGLQIRCVSQNATILIIQPNPMLWPSIRNILERKTRIL